MYTNIFASVLNIVSLFLDSTLPASHLAVSGYPVYAVSIVFFTLNIVAIGLLASSTLSVKKSESITHLKKNGRIVKIAPRVNWCRGAEQLAQRR